MSERPPDVTDAELAVLQTLWERGTATIRQITEILYPEGTTAQYGTVQKLLERLETKGYVAQEGGSGALTFHATVSRDGLISRQGRRRGPVMRALDAFKCGALAAN